VPPMFVVSFPSLLYAASGVVSYLSDPAAVSGGPGTAGLPISVYAQDGGASDDTVAGAGGDLTLVAGVGGENTGSGNGGDGGDLVLVVGAGGAAFEAESGATGVIRFGTRLANETVIPGAQIDATDTVIVNAYSLTFVSGGDFTPPLSYVPYFKSAGMGSPYYGVFNVPVTWVSNTVGSALTTIYTVTLPANAIPNNGGVEFVFALRVAYTGGTTKRYWIKCGAATLYDSGDLTLSGHSSDLNVVTRLVLKRTDIGPIAYYGAMTGVNQDWSLWGPPTGGPVGSYVTSGSGLTFTGALTFTVEAQSTGGTPNNGDVSSIAESALATLILRR